MHTRALKADSPAFLLYPKHTIITGIGYGIGCELAKIKGFRWARPAVTAFNQQGLEHILLQYQLSTRQYHVFRCAQQFCPSTGYHAFFTEVNDLYPHG